MLHLRLADCNGIEMARIVRAVRHSSLFAWWQDYLPAHRRPLSPGPISFNVTGPLEYFAWTGTLKIAVASVSPYLLLDYP